MEPAPLCSRRPAAINYVHAPTWGDQAAVLQRYWPAVTPGRRPVLVLSVGFWEKAAEVPQVRAANPARTHSPGCTRVPTERHLVRHVVRWWLPNGRRLSSSSMAPHAAHRRH